MHMFHSWSDYFLLFIYLYSLSTSIPRQNADVRVENKRPMTLKIYTHTATKYYKLLKNKKKLTSNSLCSLHIRFSQFVWLIQRHNVFLFEIRFRYHFFSSLILVGSHSIAPKHLKNDMIWTYLFSVNSFTYKHGNPIVQVIVIDQNSQRVRFSPFSFIDR